MRAIFGAISIALTCVGMESAVAQKQPSADDMDTKTFIAYCDEGPKNWCTNQILNVAIIVSLRSAEANKPKPFCPPSPDGVAAFNTEVRDVVLRWLKQQPALATHKAVASVTAAMTTLWPGECKS
jgi:hypothetical protein